MRGRRAFTLALVLSLALHLWAAPWLLSQRLPDISPTLSIEAELSAPPRMAAPPAKPPAAPTPSRARHHSPPPRGEGLGERAVPPQALPEPIPSGRAEALPVEEAPLPVAQPLAESDPEPPEPEPEPAPPAPDEAQLARDYADTLPLEFQLRFRVHGGVQGGEGGFELGSVTHIWKRQGARYSIVSVTQATGLMALLYSGLLSQTTEGEITTTGLRPGSYWESRNKPGKKPRIARFDWTLNQVSFGEGRAPGELKPGAQDMLSVVYQVALTLPVTDDTLWIADGKKLKDATMRVLGIEEVHGKPAHHYLADRGKDGRVEMWVDPGTRLPVKIMIVDPNIGAAVMVREDPGAV